MYQYKLVQKSNPQEPQTDKAMTRATTENTTTAPIEMEAALELLGKYAVEQ